MQMYRKYTCVFTVRTTRTDYKKQHTMKLIAGMESIARVKVVCTIKGTTRHARVMTYG